MCITADSILIFPSREIIIEHLDRCWIAEQIDVDRSTEKKVIDVVARYLANQREYPMGLKNSVYVALCSLQLGWDRERLERVTAVLSYSAFSCAKGKAAYCPISIEYFSHWG